MRIARRTAAVLAVSAIAGLGLTACDSGPKPVKDPSGSAQSGSKGGKVQTKPVSTKMTAENFSERMNKAQEKASSVHVEMKIETMGMSMPMSADMVLPSDNDPDKIKMRMTMDMSAIAGMAGGSAGEVPGEIEMLMLGSKDIYMSMGSATGGKYVKISDDQLQGMNLNDATNGSDPAAQAELMKKYLKDFKESGTETIDGVETTRYDITVDTAMLQEQGGADADQAMDMLGDELTYKLWVGNDDLLRKMAFDMGSAGSTEMTFSKWGEDLEITAPSPDQITEDMPGF
ncbi:MAG: hypothetical protein ACTII7_04735 [Galactobacter sp.]